MNPEMKPTDVAKFLKHKADALEHEVAEHLVHLEKMLNEAEQRCAKEKAVMWKAIAALGAVGVLSGSFGPYARDAVRVMLTGGGV